MTGNDKVRELMLDAHPRPSAHAYLDWKAVLRLAREERRQWRRLSRRTLIFAATGLVAVGALVPTSLALLGQFSQPPEEFVQDPGQPPNARKVIEKFLSAQPSFNEKLLGLRRVLTADTPEGEFGLYELEFSNNLTGTALISSETDGIGGISWGGTPPVCPPGWALQAGGSMVSSPGQTPLYIEGRASGAVASVEVIYPDGHSTPAALASGYFLAWVVPRPGAPNSRRGYSVPVTLIARDTAENELGRLVVSASGDIAPSPGQPAQARPCG